MTDTRPGFTTSAAVALARRLVGEAQNGRAVQSSLPGGGEIFLDRLLPFLLVYRVPGQADRGTRRLITGESSWLVATGGGGGVRRLVRELVGSMTSRYGAALVIELWSARPVALEEPEADPVPGFRVFGHRFSPIVEALVRSLRSVTILKHHAEVEVLPGRKWSPPGMRPIMTDSQAHQWRCVVVGLEVQPVYRSPSGEIYPMVMRRYRRQVSRALKRVCFRFVTGHTRETSVPGPLALGPRKVADRVWKIDRQLAEVAASYDLLLKVTPVNLESAWKQFRRRGYESDPEFYYRPMAVDPMVVKRRLLAIRVERIEEPILAELFRDKLVSLDRELTLLGDRGTRRFVHGSIQLFGKPTAELVATARAMLEAISPLARESGGRAYLDAEGFARRAREEIDWYRRRNRSFGSQVFVRDDIYTGLLVSRGNLLVGRSYRVPQKRVQALLHHEVGTHALTYQNGRLQPFLQLSTGLPGYDALQEGLAVLGEYLCGGLNRPRLRLLAGRVLAVQAMIDGAGFVDTFRLLTREHGFGRHLSYTIAARTHRGGGLTKDHVYLRGLGDVLAYVGRGGGIEELFVGKIATRHIPLVRELSQRGVLRPLPQGPRYLQDPAAIRRLEALAGGVDIMDLVTGGTQ